MIVVETCGETKYTSAKDKVACGSTAASHWKEHLFFEPRNIVSIIVEKVLIWINLNPILPYEYALIDFILY